MRRRGLPTLGLVSAALPPHAQPDLSQLLALPGSAGGGVVGPDGVHWQLANLSVHDGSIFPTSVVANPQLSIYAVVNRLAQGLASRLTGRQVTLA